MKKWYKKNKKMVLITGCFFCLLMIAYVTGVIYYHDKFLNGTSINGVDVSHMSVKEVNEVLAQHVSKQSIDLVFNDGNEETLAFDQLGVTYNEKNSLNDVLNAQNQWGWFLGFFSDDEIRVNDIISIDDQKLNEGIGSLEHLKTENQIAPVDAYIQYVDGKFSIVKESEGSLLKMDQLQDEIKTAIASGKKKLDIVKVGGYEEPKVREDDTDLNNKLSAANQYCLARITYQSQKGETITLDGSTMIEWLTRNEDGTYSRNDDIFKEKISEFVATLAKQMNTYGDTRTFTGADGASHTVKGGNYGFKVSQSAETNEILNFIKENKTVENRTPKATGQLTSVNGGLGDTFVEVNITKQHLWFHKNGTVIMESDFVSGTETKADRITPSGTYYLYSKERNRVLRGQKQPDGTYEYESPVSYWMPFNKGIGFHDASWRSQFGGQIYQTSGSHGCINLPTSFAGRLYSEITVNTPVVVYR